MVGGGGDMYVWIYCMDILYGYICMYIMYVLERERERENGSGNNGGSVW